MTLINVKNLTFIDKINDKTKKMGLRVKIAFQEKRKILMNGEILKSLMLKSNTRERCFL